MSKKQEKHPSPHIHFDYQPITTETTSAAIAPQISQLVRSGDKLISCPPSSEPTKSKKTDSKSRKKKQRDQQSIQLSSGDNTELSPDGNTLRSTITGYPALKISTSAKVHKFYAEVKPFITIDANNLLAEITLHPNLKKRPKLTTEDIIALCRDAGVAFGLDKKKISASRKRVNKSGIPENHIGVAWAMGPVHGQDSYLRFEIEVGSIPGKILGNGKIDFRERRMFVGIKKNDIIAIWVPPSPGTPGIDIFGNPIPQQQGKATPPTVSDDASYNTKTNEIRAIKSGILSIVNGNSIKVSARQIISGNIDYSTGNIESRDAVEINGSITPGFKVTTYGDLRISENIHSATINCGGNAVIKGGIIGKSSEANINGDCDFQFIDRATVTTGGSILVRREAYYSRLVADKDIICNQDGTTIGGTLMAGRNILVGSVGSDQAKPAILSAATDIRIFASHKKISRKAAALEKKLGDLIHRFGRSSKKKQRKKLEKKLVSAKKKLADIDLLTAPFPDPATGQLCHGNITVTGTIYSGTTIRIGNLTMTIKKTCSQKKFSLSPDNSFIMTFSLTD